MAKVWRFVPALLWAAAIFVASDQPRLPLPGAFVGLDKLLHAGAYGVLSILLLWGAGKPKTKPALGLGLVAAFYGLSDEWHQAYVPGRDSDPLDLLANTTGAFLVVGLYLRQRLRSFPVEQNRPSVARQE